MKTIIFCCDKRNDSIELFLLSQQKMNSGTLSWLETKTEWLSLSLRKPGKFYSVRKMDEMKLIAASGSLEMQQALAHPNVRTIVTILLQTQETNFSKNTLLFLKNHFQYILPEFEEDLKAFVDYYQRRPDANGAFIIPQYIIELQNSLEKLYQQNSLQIQYQRGAILELLVCRLVSPRYKTGECLGNQRFMDEHGRPISDQIDIAALSHSLRQLEGYECKLKVNGIESADCTNLAGLASAAMEREYRSNVGIVSLDNQMHMRRRLQRLQLDPVIKLYGLDTIATLVDVLLK